MKLLIASRFRTCEYLPVLALKWVYVLFYYFGDSQL